MSAGLVKWSMNPTSMSEALELSKWIAQSDLAPKEYRGKPANCLVAIGMGAELGLSPMQSLQSIACINGKPSLYGDGFLAVAQRHPDFLDIIETMSGEGDNQAATCVVKRKNRADTVCVFSVGDAKKAKLWGKEGPWSAYPLRMLKMRARGFAVRDAFPDALRGIISSEEAEDYPTREVKNVTPREEPGVMLAVQSVPEIIPPRPKVDWQAKIAACESTGELETLGTEIRAAQPENRAELLEAYKAKMNLLRIAEKARQIMDDPDADKWNNA